MTAQFLSKVYLANAREVLYLFLVPIGGGIPAGVVLGASRGIGWPIMAVLYAISDMILACVFEPIMRSFLVASKKSQRLSYVLNVLAESTRRTVGRYGVRPSPFSLIIITFGTDPMTGRSVSFAAGHGFFTGWLLTIMGDMLFFFVVMASTLWLNNVLGNGTWAAVIVTVAVIAGPGLFDKIRNRLRKS